MKEICVEHGIDLICSKAEAFGRVTVEYMMAGLTVIGSNTGGAPEIIYNNETGYLYKYGDSISFANRLEFAESNRNEMDSVGRNGQKQALKNSIYTKEWQEKYKISIWIF